MLIPDYGNWLASAVSCTWANNKNDLFNFVRLTFAVFLG
jgi:hypothetical protein